MRVLHVAAGKMYGGIESYLATVARCRHLVPGMEPRFAVCYGGRLADELSAAGVAVDRLGEARVSQPWTVWSARSRLGAVLREHRPDIVVTHGTWPHALFGPVARRHRTGLAFAAHGAPSGCWVDWWAGLTPPDVVLANSRHTAGTVGGLFPKARVEVLYLPVPAPVPVSPSARGRYRAELRTPPEATVILTACRLEGWKGHRLLLDALGRLRDLGGWMWWVAGGAQRPEEEAYLAELRDRAEGLGLAPQVRFVGQRSDVAGLMAAADVHCQPNTGPEPFGIAFVEALHAGLPVVTTALGGAAEIVDETCGVLVPAGDADRLSAALRGLIADPRRRKLLGEGGPGRARRLCHPGEQLGRLRDALAGGVG